MKPARFVTNKCRTLLISAVSSTFLSAGQVDAMHVSSAVTETEYPTIAYTSAPDLPLHSSPVCRPGFSSSAYDEEKKTLGQLVGRRPSLAAIFSDTRRKSHVVIRSCWRRVKYLIICICGLLFILYYMTIRSSKPVFRSYSPDLDVYRQKGFLQFDIQSPFSMQWVPLRPLRKTTISTGLLTRLRKPAASQLPGEGENPSLLLRRTSPGSSQGSEASTAPTDWVRMIQLAGNLSYPNIEFRNSIDYTWLLHNGVPRNGNAKYPLLEYPAEEQLAVQAAAMRATSHLHNSSILILGDSVDRNSVQQHAWTFQQNTSVGPYPGLNLTKQMFEDKHRGMPHQFTIRDNGINFTMANGFYYGVADDTENFGRIAPDWYGPGDAVERVCKYFKPLADSLEYPVKLISLHSGMWDMALWGVRDKEAGQSTETPLSEERVTQWMRRMHETIAAVKECFPGVPIVYRKIHRVGPSRGSEDWGGHGGNTITNYFTDVRFAQLQAMQERVAQEAGLAILDFGMLFEGWQQYQDKVHPQQWPGSLILAQALLHNSYLAANTRDYNSM